jgi:hypothetical protein
MTSRRLHATTKAAATPRPCQSKKPATGNQTIVVPKTGTSEGSARQRAREADDGEARAGEDPLNDGGGERPDERAPGHVAELVHQGVRVTGVEGQHPLDPDREPRPLQGHVVHREEGDDGGEHDARRRRYQGSGRRRRLSREAVEVLLQAPHEGRRIDVEVVQPARDAGPEERLHGGARELPLRRRDHRHELGQEDRERRRAPAQHDGFSDPRRERGGEATTSSEQAYQPLEEGLGAERDHGAEHEPQVKRRDHPGARGEREQQEDREGDALPIGTRGFHRGPAIPCNHRARAVQPAILPRSSHCATVRRDCRLATRSPCSVVQRPAAARGGARGGIRAVGARSLLPPG